MQQLGNPADTSFDALGEMESQIAVLDTDRMILEYCLFVRRVLDLVPNGAALMMTLPEDLPKLIEEDPEYAASKSSYRENPWDMNECPRLGSDYASSDSRTIDAMIFADGSISRDHALMRSIDDLLPAALEPYLTWFLFGIGGVPVTARLTFDAVLRLFDMPAFLELNDDERADDADRRADEQDRRYSHSNHKSSVIAETETLLDLNAAQTFLRTSSEQAELTLAHLTVEAGESEILGEAARIDAEITRVKNQLPTKAKALLSSHISGLWPEAGSILVGWAGAERKSTLQVLAVRDRSDRILHDYVDGPLSPTLLELAFQALSLDDFPFQWCCYHAVSEPAVFLPGKDLYTLMGEKITVIRSISLLTDPTSPRNG